MKLALTPFDQVIKHYAAGGMIIIIDNADRENEGDLTVATQHITAEQVNFMLQHGRGLVCVSISVDRAERLNLPLQVLNNNSPFNTPFALSVDLCDVASHGVSASARAATMRALISDTAKPQDFVSPGHVFPLIANPGGVIARAGQTEGSFDLSRIAGLEPSGVVCEILSPDGTMARGKELDQFAKTHSLPITSVAEIQAHRVVHEVLVRQTACSDLDTDWGIFNTRVFCDDVDGKEHLVLSRGDLANAKEVLVRIHSECLTGDVFGSRRCDCGPQLAQAMDGCVKAEAGVILYLRQEGRGIGLANKLKAYALQDQGHDTVEANIKLGFAADERDFAVAAKILCSLGVSRIKLLTNNPDKMSTLAKFGVNILDRVPLVVAADEHSRGYLETKRVKLGHWL